VAMGGHVRVGLEDNLWFDREREELATNARLVERIAAVARSAARDLASPAEAREIIGIAQSSRDQKHKGHKEHKEPQRI